MYSTQTSFAPMWTYGLFENDVKMRLNVMKQMKWTTEGLYIKYNSKKIREQYTSIRLFPDFFLN